MNSIEDCLKDYDNTVRNTAASIIGQIGLPEGISALDSLMKLLKTEKEVEVKAKAIWAIGRLSKNCEDGVIELILENVLSKIWKIKSACLYTISAFGPRIASSAVPILCKLLKNSNINKQTIAETLMKMGGEGEKYLIKLLIHLPDSDYILKGSIIKSFAMTDINSPNIDFIVEALYKAAQ